ncbi:MAG TPA: DUF4852 domain-containing protein [Alphaproteobacteria bacterium]
MLRTILCGALIILGTASAMAVPPAQYDIPNLQNMTDFVFANGMINPNDQDQLIEYVMIKDCDLYKEYYLDDFAWNKIRARILDNSKELHDDVITHFVMPANFLVTRYNFTTKSFDLSKSSQLINVNLMNLTKDVVPLCPRLNVSPSLKMLPYYYYLKIDTPLSLYRIPMAEDMGKKILDSMETVQEGGMVSRRLYALLYMSADSVLDLNNQKGVFLGRIDKIEFFLDQKRTQRIRTLVYSDL